MATQNDWVVTHQGGSGWEIHQPGYMAIGQTRSLLTKFGNRIPSLALLGHPMTVSCKLCLERQILYRIFHN